MLEFDYQYKFEVFFHLSHRKTKMDEIFTDTAEIHKLAYWLHGLAVQQLRNKGSLISIFYLR